MDDFMEKIKNQLKNMSEKEKDFWIISQAKIAAQWQREDFYKSLCGKKQIIYMPEKQEIDRFCEQVENGEIVIEYETHYVEFDDMGYYHDDWEQFYHDPSGAMNFLSTVFRGCHDLVILEDYSLAFEIFDRILKLNFEVVDHPETDDSCEEEVFDLNDLVKQRILDVECKEILQDYLLSCQGYYKDKKDDLVKKLVSVLEMELFKDILPSQCTKFAASDLLVSDMLRELEKDLCEAEEALEKRLKADRYDIRRYKDESHIAHIRKIIEDLKKYNENKKKDQPSFLNGTWKQISNLLRSLSYEPYIDDQVEIDEIWKICDALIKRGKFDQEPWEIKEKILKEIYRNDFYDAYGCYDPMMALTKALCTTENENLRRAGIMEESGGQWIEKMAAELYHELGYDDKYVGFYENHLGKNREAYEIVMNYYKDRNYEKAVEVAELALEKCKDDQTPFFIFLMERAKNQGDDKSFQKLNKSAHLRRAVNSKMVDQYFERIK